MKYKGFIILPEYHTGSDFKLNKHGEVIPRKPTKADIAYYIIFDPVEDMKMWIAESTVAECKATINQFLAKAGLKRNC